MTPPPLKPELSKMTLLPHLPWVQQTCAADCLQVVLYDVFVRNESWFKDLPRLGLVMQEMKKEFQRNEYRPGCDESNIRSRRLLFLHLRRMHLALGQESPLVRLPVPNHQPSIVEMLSVMIRQLPDNCDRQFSLTGSQDRWDDDNYGDTLPSAWADCLHWGGAFEWIRRLTCVTCGRTYISPVPWLDVGNVARKALLKLDREHPLGRDSNGYATISRHLIQNNTIQQLIDDALKEPYKARCLGCNMSGSSKSSRRFGRLLSSSCFSRTPTLRLSLFSCCGCLMLV
jgi:hypothetical protein